MEVQDPKATGFADAARSSAVKTLALNDCLESDSSQPGNYQISIRIEELESRRELNLLGMTFGGGLSSVWTRMVNAKACMEVMLDEKKFFDPCLIGRNSPQELFSGWRTSRSIKKHAVENVVVSLTLELVKKIKGAGEAKKPLPTNGNFMNRDRDIWPILGAYLVDVGIHESGHVIMAGFTGHKAEIRGNDTRTTRVGMHIVGGLSVFFGHRMGKDQILTFLPDVLYDFQPLDGANGVEYRYDDGRRVPNGRRDHGLITLAGILSQNLTNEYILTRHPRLIEEDNSFLKGMVFFNLVIPSIYTVSGWEDRNSDLRLLQMDLGVDRWAIDAMVLAPAVLDLYRYYRPENKKLRRYARIAKILPLLIIIGKSM